MTVIYPMKLSPCFKDYLWGGDRLKETFGKKCDLTPLAESWELACHHDGQCTIENGEYKGKHLLKILGCSPDSFLGAGRTSNELPILVKLIDAKQNLSIQVHPSDVTADQSVGEEGKAELWYIVDCEPFSYIYYGFSDRISKDEFLKRAKDGTICNVLNKVKVEKGDVYYILPGMIHSLGAGILVAEIQQNSNTTFRIFDYLRRDAQGRLRQLHLDRAVQVIDFEPVLPQEIKTNNSAYFKEFVMSEMFSCNYFRSYKLDVYKTIKLKCDGNTFHHLLFVEGDGMIEYNGKTYPCNRGDSYFMPAAMGEYNITGNCRALLSRI